MMLDSMAKGRGEGREEEVERGRAVAGTATAREDAAAMDEEAAAADEERDAVICTPVDFRLDAGTGPGDV